MGAGALQQWTNLISSAIWCHCLKEQQVSRVSIYCGRKPWTSLILSERSPVTTTAH